MFRKNGIDWKLNFILDILSSKEENYLLDTYVAFFYHCFPTITQGECFFQVDNKEYGKIDCQVTTEIVNYSIVEIEGVFGEINISFFVSRVANYSFK